MVWLSELYGYHDSPVHGFIEVVGTVGRHDDQTIVPKDKTHIRVLLDSALFPHQSILDSTHFHIKVL